jgi:hypothetical protein
MQNRTTKEGLLGVFAGIIRDNGKYTISILNISF